MKLKNKKKHIKIMTSTEAGINQELEDDEKIERDLNNTRNHCQPIVFHSLIAVVLITNGQNKQKKCAHDNFVVLSQGRISVRLAAFFLAFVKEGSSTYG
jgi:hypothetical protein